MTALAPVATGSGALVSDCGLFRYWLLRVWDSRRPLLMLNLLNPSTADANLDDPTVRKCTGFARRAGYGGIVIVNLFAYRATDPRELREAAEAGIDIVGPDNDLWISTWANRPRVHAIVGGWGARVHRWPLALDRIARALPALWETGKPVYCLGLTKDSHPRHPLMLPYSTAWLPYG